MAKKGKELVTVHLKERAFLAMILSSIEVFHHETLGVLLGYRGQDFFVVEYAIPYQTALKGLTWVEPRPRRTQRLERILEKMPVDVIGDYHSHTEMGKSQALARPSWEDVADMEESKVHLIVAVNSKQKDRKWRHNRNGGISGTLGEYHLDIGAAVLSKKGRWGYKIAKIVCPSATGIS